MHFQAYFSIFILIVPSKAKQFNKYSNCCGAQLERCFFRLLILPIFLSFNRPHTPLKILARCLANKGSAEGAEVAPRADHRQRSERRQRPRDLVVPLLLLQLGPLVWGHVPSLRPAIGVLGCLWRSRLKDGFSLFKFVSRDFLS